PKPCQSLPSPFFSFCFGGVYYGFTFVTPVNLLAIFSKTAFICPPTDVNAAITTTAINAKIF
ncbi:hypothetical protein, partial [Helcococcus ovis]|uniref:hypothetical protein n=1 Tax=Helcococcus ovis TaxID=72026 RepID=UPI0038BD83C5